MKIRSGFVSNSSSSSFILNHTDISIDDFVLSIKEIWERMYDTKQVDEFGYKFNEPYKNLNHISKFIKPKDYKTIIATQMIKKMYSDQSWSADVAISKKRISKKAKTTFLREALSATIFGTSNENAVPWEVIEELKKVYPTLIVRHLG